MGYNEFAMARPISKKRPNQGNLLVALRKAAGLSQIELSEIIGVSQQSLAFWEVSEKPPRSDVLPKLAEALGVPIEKLIYSDGENVKPRINNKPSGKVKQVFEEVVKLPRRQQEKVIEFVTAFVNQYQLNREKNIENKS
jgi:transcriptional regulator with XRE-family HTH domain